ALGWLIQLFIVPDNPPLSLLQWILCGIGGTLMLLSVPFVALVMLVIPGPIGALIGCVLAAAVWSFTLACVRRSLKMLGPLRKRAVLRRGTWHAARREL